MAETSKRPRLSVSAVEDDLHTQLCTDDPPSPLTPLSELGSLDEDDGASSKWSRHAADNYRLPGEKDGDLKGPVEECTCWPFVPWFGMTWYGSS